MGVLSGARRWVVGICGGGIDSQGISCGVDGEPAGDVGGGQQGGPFNVFTTVDIAANDEDKGPPFLTASLPDPRAACDACMVVFKVELFGDEPVAPEGAELLVTEAGELAADSVFEVDPVCGLVDFRHNSNHTARRKISRMERVRGRARTE